MKDEKNSKVNKALSYLTEEDDWQKKFYDKNDFQILTDNNISKDLMSISRNREIIFSLFFLVLGLFLCFRGLFHIANNQYPFESTTDLLLGLSIAIVSYKFTYKIVKKLIIIKKGYWFCENVSVVNRYIQDSIDRLNYVIEFSNNKSVFVRFDNYEDMKIGFPCYYISFDKENYLLDYNQDINIEFDFAYYRKDKFKYIGHKYK